MEFRTHGLGSLSEQRFIVLRMLNFASLQVRRKEADGSGSSIGAWDVRFIDFEVWSLATVPTSANLWPFTNIHVYTHVVHIHTLVVITSNVRRFMDPFSIWISSIHTVQSAYLTSLRPG